MNPLKSCPACGERASQMVERRECSHCGCVLASDWKRPPTSPIADLLRQYAEEESDFSGPAGYEFALKLARSYAARGPDSQLRCVVHTLLNSTPPLDCRTCKNLEPVGRIRGCVAPLRCVEGSSYERAGSVQLWESAPPPVAPF